ncbi:sporulation and spore germination protein [Haloactinopolyspora alba]|uniref:Sporulation and spore germination protein n=1 Tax=Haloactinopolyspora alba TaxID=648780 RepID=A0A2P8EBT6_9ACTN|nr:Gmad2 immunoglobulin-like domain-containing protein [Haloactinopolyspora alba]PSL06926.1 sporulation and spore germination protein [Haloactinopolyspora alba]
MNTPDEPNELSAEERRLRDALTAAAGQVTPGPDGLARIRRRTAAGTPWWRSPVAIGLLGASVLAVAVIGGGVALLGDDDGDAPVVTADSSSEPAADDESTGGEPSPSGAGESASGSPHTSPSGEPTGDGTAENITVPVYYGVTLEVPEGFDSLRLAREFRTVATSASPVLAALRQMADGEALDPDYRDFGFWQGDIRSVDVTDSEITVDVARLPSVEAVGSTPSRQELAVQELVYTATAAASMHDLGGSQPVRITVDGDAAGDYGGVDLSEPVPRADPLQMRQLVQIDDPTHGATVDSPVTVRGSAAAFEATLRWEIRRDGQVVEEGTTMAEECCTMSPFRFDVELEPGTYEVFVSEVDVSGGEGRPPMSDTKTFTVD